MLDGRKTGFSVPVAYWFRGPLLSYLRDVLLDPSVAAWGVLDLAAVERCIDQHVAKRRNNWYLLYKLLNLVLWRRFFLAAA